MTGGILLWHRCLPRYTRRHTSMPGWKPVQVAALVAVVVALAAYLHKKHKDGFVAWMSRSPETEWNKAYLAGKNYRMVAPVGRALSRGSYL